MRKQIIFYLVRHAESVGNISMGLEVADDISSCGLTEIGRKQAQRLGEHFASLKFHRIYTSDYLRAVETAQGILEHGNKSESGSLLPPEIQVSPKLRELDFGTLRNAEHSEIVMHYVNSTKPFRDLAFEEGESVNYIGHQILLYFESICEELFNENCEGNDYVNVLIVSHRVAIAAFLHILSYSDTHSHSMINWDPKPDTKLLKNAAYYKFQVSEKINGDEKGLLLEKEGSIPLNIEVLEKHVLSHLLDEQLDRCEVSTGKAAEKERGLIEALKKSEKGQEMLQCHQQ